MKLIYEDEYIITMKFDNGIGTYDKQTGMMISWEGSKTYEIDC